MKIDEIFCVYTDKVKKYKKKTDGKMCREENEEKNGEKSKHKIIEIRQKKKQNKHERIINIWKEKRIRWVNECKVWKWSGSSFALNRVKSHTPFELVCGIC